LTALENKGLLQSNMHFNIRWMMWFSLILLHLVTSFHRVSFNVVADLLTAEFNLTGAGLGNLAAAYTYMYVLMQIPGGILVDRLGPRRIALLTGLAMAVGSIMIGFAPSAAFVFLGRMLVGFGGSVVLINIFKFQAAWFRSTEFATMSGFALLISTSGALLAATPLAIAVSAYGWRTSFIAFGLMTILVAIFCLIIVRNSPGVKYGVTINRPNEESVKDEPVKFNLQAVKTVLSNRRLWIPFLINLGTYSGFVVFAGTWGVSYLVHVYGIGIEEASGFMVVAYIGYMVGAPSAGAISDRIGSRKTPAVVLIGLAALFWLALAAWPGGLLPLWLIYFLCVLLGLGGAATVLSFPMAREVSIPGYTGLVTAAVNLGVFLGMAILQPLFGYILDQGWQGLIFDGARIYPLEAYRIGFVVTFIFAALSFVATLFYRESRTGEKA